MQDFFSICQFKIQLVAACLVLFLPGLQLIFGEDELHSKRLFERYCLDCHSSQGAESDVDLEALFAANPIVKNRRTWKRIKQVIDLNAMPPIGSGQPTDTERMRMLDWITGNVEQFDYSSIKHPGWEQIRRLTHREYSNTMQDLLGIDVDLTDKFPSELTGTTGFVNEANTLFLQPALMERYIVTAERATELAFPLTENEPILRSAARRLFVSESSQSIDDSQAARILEKFLFRAFRRPAESAALYEYKKVYVQSQENGMQPLEALKQVIASILVSPNFLLRIEAQSGKIDDFEMASRLSYFLWSTMPDDELFELATKGKLADDDELIDQIERMLSDQRAGQFAESFVGQWLSTRLVGHEVRLDPIDQPWCTDSLMNAMRAETQMLFESVLKEDLPITTLIDADFTFANEELSRTLYGIKSVRGEEMQRVNLKHPDRRGILGHASVLAVTSNHDETSPIKRGAYVLDRILGSPPPPPPPDAGELEEDLLENEDLTLTEKLRHHASVRRCSSCHDTIDPLGVALEGFGAYGRNRSRVDGIRVNTFSRLSSGKKLNGPMGLREYILRERREDFVRNFVIRLLEYALGRPTEYFDEPAIQKIIVKANQDGLKMQSIIKAIVVSYPFRNRRELE